MEHLIYGALGLVIGLIFCYLLVRPKLQVTEKLNQEIIEQNEQVQQAVKD